MIDRPASAQSPGLCREDEPFEFGSPKPPAVPQHPQITTRRGIECRRFAPFKKAGDTKKDCFNFDWLRPQRFQRQPLRQERKGQPVLFVAERRCHFLEQGFIMVMQLHQPFQPASLALQTKLGRRVENAAYPFLRQVAQRSMTTTRSRQRQFVGKCRRQGSRIDPQLRDLPVCRRPREERARTRLGENVKDCLVEGGIARVTVGFPVLIDQIEFDVAAQSLAPIDLNGGV